MVTDGRSDLLNPSTSEKIFRVHVEDLDIGQGECNVAMGDAHEMVLTAASIGGRY